MHSPLLEENNHILVIVRWRWRPGYCRMRPGADLGVTMSESTTKQKAAETRLEKQAEHKKRIKRTLIACLIGIVTGSLAFFLSGDINPATGLQPNTLLGILLLAAGIVIQKHIFMFIEADTLTLSGKDWFYQGFMTFSLWFISWTLLLTPTVLPPAVL